MIIKYMILLIKKKIMLIVDLKKIFEGYVTMMIEVNIVYTDNHDI